MDDGIGAEHLRQFHGDSERGRAVGREVLGPHAQRHGAAGRERAAIARARQARAVGERDPVGSGYGRQEIHGG